jgi:predicted dehydrogenase
VNRRDFLQAGAASAALAAAAPAAPAAAHERPRVGLIGCGWYGKIDLLRLIQVAPVEVVSLCDVDRHMLSAAADIVASRQANHQRPQTFSDYREMLRPRNLDIVLIATPDHWHALPMIAACEAGADIYVQKPISTDVVEGQAMVAAARRHRRVVQVGLQRRSTPHLIEARDRVIRPGLLGKIAHADIYCYYPGGGQNPPDSAPPDTLDFEMWTGPAPMRPYNRMMHPRGWRDFMEYSNGTVGDMCVHMFDLVRWVLGLGWPRRISSSGGIYVHKRSKANINDTQTATFEFPDLTVVWEHRKWGGPVDPDYAWGATLYGDRGTLKMSVHRYDFIPLGRSGQRIHKDVTYELDQYPEDRTERDLEQHVAPAVRHHMLDLLAAIRTRGRPVADIEEGHISSACCILANMSQRLGRTFTWDAQQQRVVGDDEANRLLRRPYRGPWVHPTV